jgi:hypothetical protein
MGLVSMMYLLVCGNAHDWFDQTADMLGGARDVEVTRELTCHQSRKVRQVGWHVIGSVMGQAIAELC